MNYMLKMITFPAVILSLALFISGCSQKRSYSNMEYKPTQHTSAARHRATMRSYNVRGKTYQPTYVQVNDTMRGVSSWYGPNFHGKQTSNGEYYNMHGMTAAHKTWPMDTMVRVDNLKNGKSVVVRINDRGPFVSGRVIDCSYAAGKAIGLDRSGIAPVKLTVLGFAGKVYHAPKPSSATAASTPASALPKVHLTDFGVQVGAFRRNEGALTYKQKYQDLAAGKRVVVREFEVDGAALYRVWVMGFGTADEARDFISENGIQGGFLIRP